MVEGVESSGPHGIESSSQAFHGCRWFEIVLWVDSTILLPREPFEVILSTYTYRSQTVNELECEGILSG